MFPPFIGAPSAVGVWLQATRVEMVLSDQFFRHEAPPDGNAGSIRGTVHSHVEIALSDPLSSA
jgi:hypothetical protein